MYRSLIGIEEVVSLLSQRLASLKQLASAEHSRRVEATVWRGSVEVFDLVNHPTAKRACGERQELPGRTSRFVVVLRATPVDSPAAAVRASSVQFRSETGGNH